MVLSSCCSEGVLEPRVGGVLWVLEGFDQWKDRGGVASVGDRQECCQTDLGIGFRDNQLFPVCGGPSVGRQCHDRGPTHGR